MKKQLYFIFILFILFSCKSYSNSYSNHFTEEALRYDFSIVANNNHLIIYPEQIKKEKEWGGSKTQLIDKLNRGDYRYTLYTNDNQLLYSRGFNPLVQEWQTTSLAKKSYKNFFQSIRIPYPKEPVILKIENRERNGEFKTLFTDTISPETNYFVLDEKPSKVKIESIQKSGKVEHCVDLAIVAEGYTANEMSKFISDCKNMVNELFKVEPFKSNKGSFNIYAVCSKSQESGTDIPGHHIYKNTCVNSSFYTFDIERYLTVNDMKKVYDLVDQIPYDQLFVLVNTPKYGGGGFYNFINVATSDNKLSIPVFIHEFGHGFAGLADEYASNGDDYDDFYNLEIEPWEPNITTLVDFKSKWEDMISKETPIPTPRSLKYEHILGAFEGGGYVTKGMYSPVMDCRMKTNDPKEFCDVCKRAIQQSIDSYK